MASLEEQIQAARNAGHSDAAIAERLNQLRLRAAPPAAEVPAPPPVAEGPVSPGTIPSRNVVPSVLPPEAAPTPAPPQITPPAAIETPTGAPPPAGAPLPPQAAPPMRPDTPVGPTPLPEVPPEYRAGGAQAITPGQSPVQLGEAGFTQALAQAPARERTAAGFGSAGMQAIQSLQQLLGHPPKENEIKAWRAISNDPAGFVGNLAGNLALFAIPLGTAERMIAGVRAGQVAARELPTFFGRALQRGREAGTAVGLGAAENALLTPTLEGESRGTNALVGGATAGALHGGSRLFSGLVTPTEEARRLIAMGIQPTVEQGGRGALFKTLEKIAGVLPGTHWAARTGQRGAEAEGVRAAAGRGSPFREVPEVVGPGPYITDAADQARAAFQGLMQGHQMTVRGLWRANTHAQINRIMHGADPQAQRIVHDVMTEAIPRNTGRISPALWQEKYDRLLQAERELKPRLDKDDVDAPRMLRAYEAARERLTDIRNLNRSADDIAAMDRLLESNANRQIIEKAIDKVKGKKTAISMSDLDEAVHEVLPKGVTRTSAGLLQDITSPGRKVFEKTEHPDVLKRRLGWLAAGGVLGAGYGYGTGHYEHLPLAYAAGVGGLLGTRRGGARMLMGETDTQRAIANIIRGRTGTAGAILSDED